MSVSYVGIHSNAEPKFKLLAIMSLDKQVHTHMHLTLDALEL